MGSSYETDFYAWANEQVALLRAGNLAAADIDNIAEEIESMGRSEKRELVNRLAVLLTHLLKWRFQPARRSKSWRLTIVGQRLRLADHLKDNPSLMAKLDDAIQNAYRLALVDAERQTHLDRESSPDPCLWTSTQILDEEFWPS